MQISQNLVQQLLSYLETHSDPTAESLKQQLRFCLEVHQDAYHHPESTGVYRIEPLPQVLYPSDENQF